MRLEAEVRGRPERVEALCRNLSVRGLLATGPGAEVLPVGTSVELTLTLPFVEPLRVSGEVRYHAGAPQGPALGVLFTAMPEAHETRLREFLAATLGL